MKPWKPGIYQDPREIPGMSWDRRKTRFLTWFFPGRKLGNRCGGAVEIPAFSQPYPRDYPSVKPGFRWKFWDFPGVFPGGIPGISQLFPRFFPGGAPGDKKPGYNQGKTWYSGSRDKALVFTWENPGIYRFPRETDKYQGKIGFPGFSQVKS